MNLTQWELVELEVTTQVRRAYKTSSVRVALQIVNNYPRNIQRESFYRIFEVDLNVENYR